MPKPVTWRDHWNAASARTKVVAGSLIALITATAVVLGNLQKIQDYFREPPPSPNVPPIVVEVFNSSEKPIDVAARGDFFLWLPGPGARHTLGKYEFRNLDGMSLANGIIRIKADSKTRLLAHIMNEKLFAQILEQADCDIAFMVRIAGGGHRTTGDLPFTKDAIDTYSATVDIGAERSPGRPTGNKPTEDSDNTRVVVLPTGTLDSGQAEQVRGSTRVEGAYELTVDDGKLKVYVHLNVRHGGKEGIARGAVGIELLDAEGKSLFSADRLLTVGANLLAGPVAKNLSESFDVAGNAAGQFADHGGGVGFTVVLDEDGSGIVTTPSEWQRLPDILRRLEVGEETEIQGWKIKRLLK